MRDIAARGRQSFQTLGPLVQAFRELLASAPEAEAFLRDWPSELIARPAVARSPPVVAALRGLARSAPPETRGLVEAAERERRRRMFGATISARERCATISCRKPETVLSSPHDRSSPRERRFRRSRPRFRRSGAARRGTRACEFFSRRIPCNPLISLDSDERIQGNPSFSNPRFCGSPRRKRPGAKETQIGSTDRGRPPRGAERSPF